MNSIFVVLRALSEPTRLRIMMMLLSGERCVCEITSALAVGQSTLSTHLQVIRRAGLVATRREGRWIYYSATPGAISLLRTILDLNTKGAGRSMKIFQTDRLHLKKAITIPGCPLNRKGVPNRLRESKAKKA